MQILPDLKKCTSQVPSSVFINQPRYYVKYLIIGFVIKMVFKHTHSILGFLLFQIFYSRYGNSIIALYSKISTIGSCLTCEGQPCCKGNWDATDRYSKPFSNDGGPLHDLPAGLPSCYEPKRSRATAYCQRA